MFINDLEFIESCEGESASPDLLVRGGSAFASVSIGTGQTSNSVYAFSSASAGGDISGTSASTGAVLVNQSYYAGGYTVATGAAVGADFSGSYVTDFDYSFSLV